jgi:hypothetical protein
MINDSSVPNYELSHLSINAIPSSSCATKFNESLENNHSIYTIKYEGDVINFEPNSNINDPDYKEKVNNFDFNL